MCSPSGVALAGLAIIVGLLDANWLLWRVDRLASEYSRTMGVSSHPPLFTGNPSRSVSGAGGNYPHAGGSPISGLRMRPRLIAL